MWLPEGGSTWALPRPLCLSWLSKTLGFPHEKYKQWERVKLWREGGNAESRHGRDGELGEGREGGGVESSGGGAKAKDEVPKTLKSLEKQQYNLGLP